MCRHVPGATGRDTLNPEEDQFVLTSVKRASGLVTEAPLERLLLQAWAAMTGWSSAGLH